MLLDEAVNGAAIGGEIEGVLVGVPEEPEQIVGELSRHVVDINLDRHTQWVVGISIQPPGLGGREQIVEFRLAGESTDGVIWRRRVVKEMFEGGNEGGLGGVGAGKSVGGEMVV